MKANIFNVQRFCTNDGPGIRTTVFFKGCPLHCLWCHNPESQLMEKELMYNSEKCVNCMRCVAACPKGCHVIDMNKHRFDRTDCIACGKCLSPFCEALDIAGGEKSVDEIFEEVLKDELFYKNSGGGITLSGGEPLMQWEACLELLGLAKEKGIHTCIETCGAVSKDILEKTLPLIDIYLFDCKETDPQRHKEYTGVDNHNILENLKYLDSMNKATVLRCPIIPTLNDRDDHFEKIAEIANSLDNIIGIEIEPYHTIGVGKYENLGRNYSLPDINSLDDESTNRCIDMIKNLTDVSVKKA